MVVVNKRDSHSVIEYLKAAGPILIAFIGAGLLTGATASERYRLLADALAYGGGTCVLAALMAGIWPIAVGPPARLFLGELQRRRLAGRNRRAFHEWCQNWRTLSRLLMSADQSSLALGEGADGVQPVYQTARVWFFEHEGALNIQIWHEVDQHLGMTWGNLTEAEQGFHRHGFPYFYRLPEAVRQLVTIEVESGLGRERGRRSIESLFEALWTGLTRASSRRGWGSIGTLNLSPVLPEQSTAPTDASPNTRVPETAGPVPSQG